MKKLLVFMAFSLLALPTHAQTIGTSASVPYPVSSYGTTTGLFSDSSGNVGIASAGTEIVRINGTGLRVGTTTPLIYPLDIQGVGINVGGNFYAPVRVLNTVPDRGFYLGYDSTVAGSGIIASNGGPLEFWNYNGSNWVERMRVAGSGSLGIGTTSPQNLLDVNGAASIGYNVAAPSNGLIVSGNVAIGTTTPASSEVGFDVAEPIIRFGQNPYPANYPSGGPCSSCTYLVLDKNLTANDASIVFRDTGNARAEIGIVGDDNLHFKTVSGTYGSESFSDRMIILGAGSANPGNVGIGTTIPSSLLSVGSNSEFQVAYSGRAWAQGYLHAGTSTLSGAVAEFQGISSDCLFTPSSGGTFSCSSDVKFKTDIEDTADALPSLDDMRIRDFTIKASGDRQTGVIAQEMQQTHPEMVHQHPRENFLVVDQPNPWMLVKAIQELHGIVLKQQDEIDELKQTITQLTQQK